MVKAIYPIIIINNNITTLVLEQSKKETYQIRQTKRQLTPHYKGKMSSRTKRSTRTCSQRSWRPSSCSGFGSFCCDAPGCVRTPPLHHRWSSSTGQLPRAPPPRGPSQTAGLRANWRGTSVVSGARAGELPVSSIRVGIKSKQKWVSKNEQSF